MPAAQMEGRVFGRLTVVRPAGRDGSGSFLWDCVCSCGGTKKTRGYSLRRGDTRSCGCLLHEQAHSIRTRYASGEEAAWAFAFNAYQRNARFRQVPCDIDFAEFVSLCSRPCHYCGRAPEARPKQRGRGQIHASGIDRVDNARGYEAGNVVPCCTWCNRAKNHHTPEEFVKHCMDVAANAAIARRE